MNFLKVIWRKWLPIAQAIGNFQAQVILSLFYLVVILPLGFFFRIFVDPLSMGRRLLWNQKTNFRKWEHSKQSLDETRKQY